MIIETQEDWNSVLAGCECCEMPVCPVPTKECENRTATVNQDYESEGSTDPTPPDGTMYYSWATFECEEGDPTSDMTYIYRKSVLTEGDIASQPDDTYTCTLTSARRDTNFERYGEYVISDPISLAEILAAANEALDLEEWSSPAECESSFTKSWPQIGDFECDKTCLELFFGHSDSTGDWRHAFGSAALIEHRFRWVIPDTWPGSYFKITWDILEEPDGWDDETPTVFRSFHLTDQTWTWVGPGDPEDADSWKSDWYVIEPPEVAGTRRVVNVRFECYKSAKFGVKPQVTGEAVELPDP